ncbi:U8 snoRNA-decapping enzyme [Armadillidium vulgare]|nr:U8 snoRNA-decapping enzyme [Armadillidium vulgare]
MFLYGHHGKASQNFGVYKAAVLMHVRFDGTFGFAGGIIDEGEDLLDGLHRELEEEIAWDSEKHRITMSDYFNTQINDGKNLVLHFFTKQIPYEDLVELEKRCLTSKEFGIEVLGTVRVPLYTMNNEYGGLPAFLNNKFIGTAKQQLLLSLHHTRILNESEIEETMYKSQNMKLAPSRF